MKLNSAWRALLWEELYVGGYIVAVMLGASALIALSIVILFPKPYVDWHEVDIFCYLLTYATTILLLLQISNSGEMHIGIPRRILSLPVDASLMVSVSFLVRGFLVIAFTILSRIIVGVVLLILLSGNEKLGVHNYKYISEFRQFFPMEVKFLLPLLFPSIVHILVYVTLQFICWLFILSPVLVVGFVILSFLVSLVALGGNAGIISKFFSVFLGYSPYLGLGADTKSYISYVWHFIFIAVLILYVSFVWFLSIEVVSRLRAGGYHKFSLSSKFLSIFGRFQPGMIIDRFSSSRIAQLWFEMKSSGLLIPVWTFLFFIVLNTIYVLILVIRNIMNSNPQFHHTFSPTFVVLVLPYIALLLSGVVWYLKVNRKVKRDYEKGVFQLSYIPLTRKERVCAYWLAGNINLFVTLLIIWLIEFIYLCWLFNLHVIPHPFFSGIIEIKLQGPFTNMGSYLFPLLNVTLRMTIFFGLLVWLTMFNPSALLLVAVLVLCLVSTGYYGVIWGITGGLNSVFYQLFNLRNWFSDSFMFVIFLSIYLYSVLVFLLNIFIAVRNHIFNRREILFLLLISFVIFISTTAWDVWDSVHPVILVASSIFITAVFANAWVRIHLIAYGCRLPFTRLPRPSEEDVVMNGSVSSLLVGYLLPLLFALLTITSNFDKGINDKVVAYLKDNSLPLSLKEVNDKYHSLNKDDNLCSRYYALISKYNEEYKKAETEYLKKGYEKNLAELSLDEDKICLERIWLGSYRSFTHRDKPIPRIAYSVYKGLLENVYKELIEQLENIAESGLGKGSYPIDLMKGFSVELPHLAVLRDWVRILGLKAIISAVDGDYDAMMRVLRTSASIYKSLEDEPIYISQLVRIAIFRIVYEDMEWIINHRELPENVLLNLEEVIDSFSVPIEKRSIFNSALHTELLNFLSVSGLSPGKMLMANSDNSKNLLAHSFQAQLVNSWSPVLNIFYSRDLEQMVGVNLFVIWSNIQNEIAREEQIDIPKKLFLSVYVDRLFERSGDSLFASTPPYWFYPILRVTFPALSRAIDTELRHYALINLAKTALAIERFRIKNGSLPEKLDSLVPTFLYMLPKDPWDSGGHVKYIRGENFSYKVYSIGVDGKDDGGIEQEVGIRSINSGDYVFHAVGLSARNRPDVSDEISLSEFCR